MLCFVNDLAHLDLPLGGKRAIHPVLKFSLSLLTDCVVGGLTPGNLSLDAADTS